MAVNYTRLRSEYGFESPSFTVDETGNITANVVTVSSLASTSAQLYLENFVFNGSSINTNNNTNIVFLTDIEVDNILINSDITSKSIKNTDPIEIDSSERVIIKNSPLNLKSYTTIDRDLLTAETGDIIFNSSENKINYYTSSWKSIGTGELVINGTTISAAIDNNITIDPQGTGTVIVDDLKINNSPTQLYHATRKDYVDRRITALSIALGV